MKQYRKYIWLLNLVLVLFLFNRSVWHKEQTLQHGRLVLLPLAPVDPRSLMQGDYMQLNYALVRNVPYSQNLAKRGYCIVTLDDSSRATPIRFQPELQPLKRGELPIKYFIGEYRSMRIGAESYFFQEGTAERYARAKYGALKVDEKGNSVLYGLYDERVRLIERE